MADHSKSVTECVQQAIELLDQVDSFAAVDAIRKSLPPEQLMAGFQELIHELFTQRKLARMIWVARSAIEHALNSQNSAWIESARKLAYNVSADLWPGWGDAAVQPNESDLAAALDLARCHRRWCQAAELDPEKQGHAHWLVGAQRLALGQEQSAHHEFELAFAAYRDAKQPILELMAEGYIALSLALMGTMASEGQRRLESAMSQLKQLGDDGDFFADQLQVARKVFVGK